MVSSTCVYFNFETECTRCDQKVLGRYCSVRFIESKSFSRSFDLIKGHWERTKHASMLGCLCKAILKEKRATHLQNDET